MPIQYPGFNVPNFTPEQLGQPDLSQRILGGLKAGIGVQYAPRQASEDLLKAQLANKKLKIELPYISRLKDAQLRALSDAHEKALMDRDPNAKIAYINKMLESLGGGDAGTPGLQETPSESYMPSIGGGAPSSSIAPISGSQVPSIGGDEQVPSLNLNAVSPYDAANAPRSPKQELMEEYKRRMLLSLLPKLDMSGPAKEQQGIRELEMIYGKDSPYVKEARDKFNKQGIFGGLGGTGARDQMMFVNGVASDNPQFSPEDAQKAAGVLLQGGRELPDGRPINQPSGLTRMAMDRAIRATTTSPLITQQAKANQAEAEIGVLQKYANEGMADYGATYANYSPAQIFDTLKTDVSSQKKLGRLIAAQALQYEIAQNRIRLAQGQPSVTSTQELMALSGQSIRPIWAKMSSEARREAAKYMDEALSEGNKARQRVGFSPSSLLPGAVGESRGAPSFSEDQEVIIIDPQGKKHLTPESNARNLPKGWKRG